MRHPFSFWRGGSVFNPTTQINTNHFYRANFSASPWAGTASLGTSSSFSMSEATHPPNGGTAVNGLTPAQFTSASTQLLTGSATLSQVIGSGATQSCWGWVLFNAQAAFTDPGTAAGRLTIPAFFVDINEVVCVGFSSGGCSVAVDDTGSGSTSVILAASTGAWHLMQWRIVDSGTLEVSVDGSAFTTASFAGKSINSIRTAAVKIGCRGSSLLNFLSATVADICVVSGTATAGTMANVKAYINARYAMSF